MKPKFSLTDVRKVWVEAYFRGEIDWLEYIESPFFFVKRGSMVISRRDQLLYIERNQKKFSSVDISSIKFEESIEEICEHDGWATIAGSAVLSKKGKEIAEYSFFELWLILNNRWQVASLCYDENITS